MVTAAQQIRSAAGADAQAAAERAPERIDSLTSLRFFACFFVVYYHANTHFFGSRAELNHDSFTPILAFFFALSGFVLTHNYFNLNGAKSIASFYLFRYSRMLPIHIMTALLLVSLLPELFRPRGLTYFANLSLTQAWIPWSGFFFSYNSPSWSSSTEMFFYLCFPLLLFALRKNWSLPLIIGFVPMLVTVVACNVLKVPHFSATEPCVIGWVFVHPLARIFEFALGMVTALAFRKYLKSLNINFFVATFVELCALAFVVQAALNGTYLRFAFMPMLGDAGATWLQSCGIPVAGCAVLIAALATQRGLLSRVLSLPFMVALGEASFAIYMLHCVLLTYASINFPQSLSFTSYLLYWATLMVAGHLLTTVIDPFLRKWMLKPGLFVVNKVFKDADGENSGKPRGASKPKLAQAKGFSKNRWALLAAEVCLLAVLVWCSLPALNRVAPPPAHEIATYTTYGNMFAPYLECTAATAQTQAEGVHAKMIWRSLQEERVDFFITVTALDAGGAAISARTYAASPRREVVPAGTYWTDQINVGVPGDKRARTLTVSVMRKHKLIAANGKEPAMVVPIRASVPD